MPSAGGEPSGVPHRLFRGIGRGADDRLSWLIADNDSLRFDREQVEDYIRRIQSSRMKKSSEEVSQMSPDKLDDYIKKIAENKRG